MVNFRLLIGKKYILFGLLVILAAISNGLRNPMIAKAAGTARTIANCSDLETIRDHLDDTYILTQNLDCFDEARTPIGDHSEPFTGTFNGGGHTIRTYIGTGVFDYAGLFGSISGAEVSYLNLEGLVIATGGNVGGLAGEATGNSRVTHVTSSMEIQAAGDNAGGLIGALVTNVTGSFSYNAASGDVSGDDNVGGLYGYATLSNISKSYATGDVTASGENAGGLIGYSGGYGASEVYATGDVTAGELRAGGLIGLQEGGDISDSYARGNASASSPGYYVGGLIGAVNGTYVRRAYATGSASGSLAVGGLVGYSVGETYIFDAFSTGLVNGEDATINSFVGQDFSDFLISSHSFANADNEKYCMVNSNSEEVNNCTQISISENPTRFFSASEEPLRIEDEQLWDTEDVWQTSNTDYPTLRFSPYAISEIGQDLNGDFIPDSEQPNIGGYTSLLTGKTVAIDVGEGCELTTDNMTDENSLPIQDSNFDYENGLWDWEADCSVTTTTIKLYYYNVSSSGLTARKFSTISNTYFNLTDATISQTTINGQSVTIVTYQITDNSERDMNPDDGTISDPVGVATVVPTANQGQSGALSETGSDGIIPSLIAMVVLISSATLLYYIKYFYKVSN